MCNFCEDPSIAHSTEARDEIATVYRTLANEYHKTKAQDFPHRKFYKLRKSIIKKHQSPKKVSTKPIKQEAVSEQPKSIKVESVATEERFNCLCCNKDITDNVKQTFGDLAKQYNVTLKKVIETRITDENNRKFYNTCLQCVINNNKKN